MAFNSSLSLLIERPLSQKRKVRGTDDPSIPASDVCTALWEEVAAKIIRQRLLEYTGISLQREGGVAALVATLQLTYPLSSWCSLPLFPTYAVKGLVGHQSSPQV
jgi:hypothetical protein